LQALAKGLFGSASIEAASTAGFKQAETALIFNPDFCHFSQHFLPEFLLNFPN
jgi:hypothetical protein